MDTNTKQNEHKQEQDEVENILQKKVNNTD